MSEKPDFFDKPGNVRMIIRVFVGLCAGLVVVDFLYHRHVTHPWENLWGFYAIYGFVACVILVLAAKEMRKLLMRDENYYRDDVGDGSEDIDD